MEAVKSDRFGLAEELESGVADGNMGCEKPSTERVERPVELRGDAIVIAKGIVSAPFRTVAGYIEERQTAG